MNGLSKPDSESDPLYLFYLRRLAQCKPSLIQGAFGAGVFFFWTKFRTKEELADNSWRLLVAVILLNKTYGKAAIPVFWSVMKDWPTPYHLSQG